MKKEQARSTRRELLTSGGAIAVASTTGMLAAADAASAHEVAINAMGPTPEQLQQFLALPEGPIVMVNLLKFKPDGGREE